MRFSLSLSIAILAVFASVQATKSEGGEKDVQEGSAEVQGKGGPQSRLRIPPECLGQHEEVLQECLDGAELGSADPEDLDVGED
ncbi:hypothetical protein O0I10_000434 [Lichtheimia ornata]|uniref:Uncharacterized protein n=1 Tax=Lichtheimia ornata TaxID=688661 RepID=A0AAD8DJG2_9FUNG|nr:uncharacterized protein O0I10_000434 [Lichtheimia ornata]KAJ8664155.1 hypothetical protein O0I10_000434 [Lichtheimia ornata]